MPIAGLDSLVADAIRNLFPTGKFPDQENFLPDGTQYKAPDHEILDGRVLIERKSLNSVDDSQFYEKLVKIAAKQGGPFRAYGMNNLANFIKNLPEPNVANKEMVDYTLNQLKKDIGKARKKFESHAANNPNSQCARILICADQSEMKVATDWIEYFIGEQFIKSRIGHDEVGLIDAIVYLKNPKCVLDDVNSYWFKCLIRKEAHGPRRTDIGSVSYAIYQYLKLHNFKTVAAKFKKGSYRALIA